MPLTARRVLDIRRIWAEPDALASERGRQIHGRFPDAEVIDVPSHWAIPDLHGNAGNLDRWGAGEGRGLGRRDEEVLDHPMACVYSYVPRRKG